MYNVDNNRRFILYSEKIQLWESNDEWKPFDPTIDKISDVFSISKKNIILPYRRKYRSLNKNQLLKLIDSAQKNHWQALDLSNCGLTELPDELWKLTDLRILYLGNNNHRYRRSLANSIATISNKIEELQNLQALSIGSLHCTFEKESPLDLPNLLYLDIYDCGFHQIPNALMLPSLKGLGFNCLEDHLHPSFSSLFNLEEAFLTRSKIRILPDDIDRLQYLETIFLYHSDITLLPSSIKNMRNLRVLRIADTPLAEYLPPEIVNQSAQDIIRYVFMQKSSIKKEYFNESKLIIVGQGRVGKTSLLKRLIYDTFDEEKSTEGINISQWDFQLENKDFRLNIWDFGGQEIYHATHQFFLTKRSLYLLVWDALAEEEYGRVDYWLKTIQSLADDSPIILVVNKCDKEIGRINRLDIKEYQDKYPQIQDILYVSCKDNIEINELKDLIQKTAVRLPLMKMKWITTWMNVRKKIELKANKENYITKSEYIKICKSCGIIDDDEALSLIKYLHDLGIVLYYHDDFLLKGLIILSSEWGTDAVYKVLDEQERKLKGRNGVLLRNDLPAIWNHEKYPQEYYQHLLNLMEKFQLAFKIDDNSYLVAELLNIESIDLGWQFKKSDTLSFRYEYDFLPAGIMTRFIVSANQYLVTENDIKQCWRKGAYLFYRSAKARVRLFDSEQYIQIDVIGENARDKKEFLSRIREQLDKINSKFSKIKITEKIPCCCSEECKFLFKYETLLTAEIKNKRTVECHDSLEDVPLSKLLDGIEYVQTGKDNNVYVTNNFNYYNPSNLPDDSIFPTNSTTSDANKNKPDKINTQLISWAKSSDLYQKMIGESQNNEAEQWLSQALGERETDCKHYSYKLMEKIWKSHPEFGLMPDYTLFDEFENTGKYHKKYRDHLAHMFKVFLLGLYLYEKSPDIQSAFNEKNFDPSKFASIWTITALYHDIGYLFEALDSAIDGETTQQVCNNLIKTLSSPFHQLYEEDFTDSYEKNMQKNYKCFPRNNVVFADLKACLKKFIGYGSAVGLCIENTQECNPIEKYYNIFSGLNKERCRYDHGISSAIILLFMQESLSDYITNYPCDTASSNGKENPI